MSQMTRFASTGGLALALCAAFAGCSSRTNVSVTGSTPSQFTHVFITTAEVWFNTNANAGADDSGWAKFPLKTPVTVDLVQQSNGTLGEVASDLRLAPGTYKTILLMPLISNSTAASASATAAGATYNQEADFVDTVTGVATPVPLVLPNPEKGIVVPGGTLSVPVGKTSGVGVGLGSKTNNNTLNSLTNTNGTTNNTTNNNTTTTNNTNNTTTVTFASSFDGNRDVHLFNYSGCNPPLGPVSNSQWPVCGSQPATPANGNPAVSVGAVLSSNPAATDLSTTGGITGTLTLSSTAATNLPATNTAAASDRIPIQASAEALSADGTHHVIVATAPVQTDGTFTIYPLQSNSRNPTAYDVVIHGPNIATILIKNVTVTTTTPTTTAAASSTGAVATTTASGAVSLGTFVPRGAHSFFAQVAPTSAASLPPGAAVIFYQTLTASGEVPYAIDEVGIDPINLSLAVPEQLSAETIDTGTYSSSGSTITLTQAKPAEGAGTYKVGATAPLFVDGTISANTVVTATPASTLAVSTAPTPLPSITPVTVTVPALTPANSAASGSINATITVSGGPYQGGQLLVSHNGAVVGSASLNSVLSKGGGSAPPVNGLPSGVGNYYLSVIVWGATTASYKYESVGSPVTVSAGGQTAAAVTIN
jgi:Domain of unknown function (DUF4382)